MDLTSRDEVQSYLLRLADDLGVPLDDAAVATELDKRDELASFGGRFEVPKIGDLLEEEKRDPGQIASSA